MGPPARLRFLRPALLLGVAGLSPLTWAESLGARGAGALTPGRRTGIDLLTSDAGTAVVVLTLAALAGVLAWVAPRLGPWLATLTHLLGSVACAALGLLVHFVASFSVFDRREVFPPAWAAMALLALCAVEALTRASFAFSDALRAHAGRSDD